MFRSHLLAKQGRLIDVPQEMAITVEQLADYMKPALTAAAGGSLDVYRNLRRFSSDAHPLLLQYGR